MNYLMDAVNEARAAAERLTAAAQLVDGEREGNLAIDVKLHGFQWAELGDVLPELMPNDAYREAVSDRIAALLQIDDEGEHGLHERFLERQRDDAAERLVTVFQLPSTAVGFAGRSGGWLTLLHAGWAKDERDDLEKMAADLERWAQQQLGDVSDPERSVLAFLDMVSDDIQSLRDETESVNDLAARLEHAVGYVRIALAELPQTWRAFLKDEVTNLLDGKLTWRDFAHNGINW